MQLVHNFDIDQILIVLRVSRFQVDYYVYDVMDDQKEILVKNLFQLLHRFFAE